MKGTPSANANQSNHKLATELERVDSFALPPSSYSTMTVATANSNSMDVDDDMSVDSMMEPMSGTVTATSVSVSHPTRTYSLGQTGVAAMFLPNRPSAVINSGMNLTPPAHIPVHARHARITARQARQLSLPRMRHQNRVMAAEVVSPMSPVRAMTTGFRASPSPSSPSLQDIIDTSVRQTVEEIVMRLHS